MLTPAQQQNHAALNAFVADLEDGMSAAERAMYDAMPEEVRKAMLWTGFRMAHEARTARGGVRRDALYGRAT